MSRPVLFDSSVLIDQFRTNLHAVRIAKIDGLVRLSSVVLSELMRGAKGKAEVETLRFMEKNLPILTPNEKNWLESGQILARMYSDRGFAPQKLRDLHFDVLIALTARQYGARLITSNRSDFELIRTYREFDLEVW